MAIGGGGGGGSTGIQVELTWGAYDTLELYRDTSSGFGTQVLIAELAGGFYTYTDYLPLDGVTRYYRCRARRDGYTTTSYVNLGAPDGIQPVTLST